MLAAIALSLGIASDTLPFVFRCLGDGTRCSAGRASGLIGLDMFGVSVVVVEATW